MWNTHTKLQQFTKCGLLPGIVQWTINLHASVQSANELRAGCTIIDSRFLTPTNTFEHAPPTLPTATTNCAGHLYDLYDLCDLADQYNWPAIPRLTAHECGPYY